MVMKHIYEGKTKSVFQLEDGNYLLKMKDAVTGAEGKIDPGANQVIGQVSGMGHASLKMSEYFFEKFNAAGIKTHFISADLTADTMTVKPAEPFGAGLEFICRFRAYGSFLRRYGKYAQAGQQLQALVEITLKDDDRGDPLINEDALEELQLLSKEECAQAKSMTKRLAEIIRADLGAKGMELYDIKFEFGRSQGQIMLIDEVSGGNMRVFKDGQQLEALTLTKMILA